MAEVAEMIGTAVRHQQAGRHAEAVAAYRRLLGVDPGQAEVYANLGIALKAQGRFVEADEPMPGATSRSLAVGDVDADGDLDVVSGFPGQVWLNRGDGLFDPGNLGNGVRPVSGLQRTR